MAYQIRRLVLSAAGILAAASTPHHTLGQVSGQHERIRPVVREPEYPVITRPTEDSRQRIVLPSEAPEYCDDPSMRSGGAVGQVPLELRRLPEGYVLANRAVHIERQGAWYVVNVKPAKDLPDAPPLRILPNSQLALLETVLEHNPASSDFNLTGRVTEFNGSNYVLIDNLTQGSPARPRPLERPGGGAALPGTPSTQPAGPGETQTGPAREPTPEEVVQQLMRSKPRRALVIPPQIPFAPAATQPTEVPLPVNPQRGRAKGRWAEDTNLVDRPGRLISTDGEWSFAFEDLSYCPQEKPVRLLPNQLLEIAIQLSGGGTRSVVLIISGEIAVHKGTDYLLLRKAMVRRDLGNFR